MSKRFKRGLVVGKFAPLHRGHELVIDRALDECEEVIIISYCKPEFPGCEAAQRQTWLSHLFPAARILVPTDASLADEQENGGSLARVPNNDADPTTHRRFCGFLCTHVLDVTVDAVFTSEGYGDGFAQELTCHFRNRDESVPEVQHVLVDQARQVVPVSGTTLRKDIHVNRQWVSPQVYSSFVRRICVLGGESSGKSTLTETLAADFGTRYVHEYGRDLWEQKNGILNFDDMLQIGLRQLAMEDEAAGSANRFLFCDTSPLTTLFYSRHLFGRAEPELERLAERRYDTVILCAPDFPFIQDGTRQPESFREHQHKWYLQELAERQIPFVLAKGSLADRVQAVSSALR